MKTKLFFLVTMLVFSFPSFAQDNELTEEEPVQLLVLKKGNIPEPVLKTAEKLFSENTQVKWGVFPYQFKDYGWQIDKSYDKPIDHYEILFTAHNGATIDAVFESTGELIRYREVNKNAILPMDIAKAIEKTQYKGWQVLKGTEVVNDNQNKVVEHYTVRLENGKHKKTLHFTRQGKLLENK